MNLKIVSLLAMLLTVILSACDTKTPGFSLGLNPTSLALEQGQSKTITVTVVVKDGFKSAVDVTIESAAVTASPLKIAEGQSTGTLTLTAKADAATSSSTVKVKGSSGTLSSESNLQVAVSKPAISKKVVTGQLQDYSLGAAQLTAKIDSDSLVGTGSVNEIGVFSLELGVPPDSELQVYLAPGNLGLENCVETSVTPSSFKFAPLGFITLVQNSTEVALVFQATSTTFLGNLFNRIPSSPVVPGKIVLWIYADRAVRLTAQCEMPDFRYDLPGRIDISLQPGWNALVNEVSTTEISLTSAPVDLPWLFSN
jgi:hypothetical protein